MDQEELSRGRFAERIVAALGMRILVIDDLRIFTDLDAVYARTSEEAIARLNEDPWDQVWFDHDLGGEDTIEPVLTHIERTAFFGSPFDIGECIIHTANPVGAQKIAAALGKLYPTKHVYAGGLSVSTIETADDASLLESEMVQRGIEDARTGKVVTLDDE